MKPINVGLLGIGTVGGGTFTVLKRNEAEITRRAGRAIRISVVADKTMCEHRGFEEGGTSMPGDFVIDRAFVSN